jgi:orotate phosphoribosyltransferase
MNYNLTTEQEQFIKLCLDNKNLCFGKFVLKSNVISHYFFNAGLFNTGNSLKQLGDYYAKLIKENIIDNNLQFDCLFGPAYKGIAIATSTAIALSNNYNFNASVAFNRKEQKTHGEGGNIIGADINNKKILLIDDVISGGVAIKESINILKQYNATISAVVISLDRKMPTTNQKYRTAAEEITGEFNIPIYSIITIDNIIAYTQAHKEYNYLSDLLINQ